MPADTLPAVHVVQLFTAIGLTLGSWILLGALCAGVGLLAHGMQNRRAWSVEALLSAFWSGLCIFIGFLQLYNFARPIDAIPFCLLALSGTAGFVIHRRAIFSSLAVSARTHPISSAALVLVLIFLADRAIGSPGWCYDTGLYHASVVRWALTAPVVPGLANLHCRLGFNNSIHLFGAAITAGPWGHLAPHIVNGLIFAALAVQGAIALSRLFWAPGRSDIPRSILDALILPPFVLMACQYEVAGFSSDGAAAAMIAVAASRIVGITLSDDEHVRLRREFFIVSLLLSTAVTVKLSTAPFAGIAWIVAAALTFRHERSSPLSNTFRQLAAPALIAGALLGPWMIRGVILSGYPLFPSKILAAPVAWRVPPETADALTAVILSWPRNHGAETGDWLLPWIKWAFFGQVFWITVPLIFAIAGAILFACMRRRPPARLWMVLPCTMGIIAWFLTAPDPRFAFVLFWILGALLLGAASMRTPFKERVLRHTIAGVTLALAVAAMVQRPPFIGPGPDHGFHPMPEADVKEVFTESGLKIYIPVFEDKSWDAPLPCAPFLTPGLKLRVPGSMISGFMVDRSAPASSQP